MSSLKKIPIIVLGNFLLALGIGGFMLPSGLITGGSTGIILVLRQFFDVDITMTLYVINISMFFIGLYVLGKKFALGTLLSTIIFPAFLTLVQEISIFESIANDLIISSIYAGVFIGVGMGLVLRVGASTGGMDIPPLVINKKTGISVALLINILDVSILLGQFMFSTIEQVLYGILVVIVTTLIINQMLLLGQSQVQVTIISRYSEEIRNAIYEKLDRGCTFLNITTGYTREKQNAIMVVVENREVRNLHETVLAIDEHAFIISNNAHSVKGRGFTLPSIDL